MGGRAQAYRHPLGEPVRGAGGTLRGVDHLQWTSRPALRSPVLVCAFRGWSDGGQAASLAATFVRESLGGERFCDVDPEEFYDFQETRPTVRLEDGLIRRIDWPDNTATFSELPGTDRDIVVLLGTEPQLRWRTFSKTVLELVQTMGIELVVTLGGLAADTPHTRPVPVTGSAEGDLGERLGLSRSSYEGPTGIVGVLHDALREASIPSASLWAAVPHYISVSPNPKAALALLDRLGALLETHFETMELGQAAVRFERQVSSAVSSDDDVSTYVRDLERRADAGEEPLRDLPTGDELAAELQKFLSDRSRDLGDGHDAE
jgi:proteasome assembly chaperone (PAC2) family protein